MTIKKIANMFYEGITRSTKAIDQLQNAMRLKTKFTYLNENEIERFRLYCLAQKAITTGFNNYLRRIYE